MANTNTPLRSDPSIVELPHGKDIDVMATLEQIGFWTRARIGFVVGSVLYDRSYFKFQISLDHKPRRWVVIKLVGDLYTIEIGRLVKKFYWRVEKTLEGVGAEELSEVLERLFQEVYA